ncbi:hypothetical protein MXB_4228 [Myxobolus squamalis]|nr:hypothetical protein MXB_4228 [Myxobolus squamalis]
MVDTKKLLSRIDYSYCRYVHVFRDSNDREYTLGFKNDNMLVREDSSIM